MIKKILVYPHPLLRKKCIEVTEFSEEVKQVTRDLEETLKFNLTKAVGLAANQIGYSYRIIAFVDLHEGNIISMINPQVTYFSDDDMVTEFESCASYPNRRMKIKRAREVIVTGYSVSGIPIKYSMEDLQARIIQHEIEHLNGLSRLSKR
jgi:peptide deformylase